MEFPTLINWTIPSPLKVLMGDIFHFYSNFDKLIELRGKVSVDNISVMLGLLPQVKQISPCQQTKYDDVISLKAAAERTSTYHP